MKLGESTLRLESLSKIKDTISPETFKSLSETYQSQINLLTAKKDVLVVGLDKLKTDINLDSNLLSGEVSILGNELLEVKLMFEVNAISKQEYDTKIDALEKKINKNKKLLSDNESCTTELNFYATHVGTDSYLRHSIKRQADTTHSVMNKFGHRFKRIFKPKYLILLIILTMIVLSSIYFYVPLKRILEERIAWNKSTKADNYEAYDLYLLTYPNGKFKKEASISGEEALWKLAMENSNQSSLKKYLETFVNGKYSKEAAFVLDSLVWDSIARVATTSAYQYYIKKFPGGSGYKLANSLLSRLSAGYLVDDRDNKKYKIANIGEQIWMAENLNYETSSGSICCNLTPDGCVKYGRLYSQEIARNVCPTGWHLPLKEEYEQLMEYLGDDDFLDDKLFEGGASGFNASLSGAYYYLPASEGAYKQGFNLHEFGESVTYWAFGSDRFNKYGELSSIYISEDMVSIESTDEDEGVIVYLFIRCLKD